MVVGLILVMVALFVLFVALMVTRQTRIGARTHTHAPTQTHPHKRLSTPPLQLGSPVQSQPTERLRARYYETEEAAARREEPQAWPHEWWWED